MTSVMPARSTFRLVEPVQLPLVISVGVSLDLVELRRRGVMVHECASAADALGLLGRHPDALVFAAASLPGMPITAFADVVRAISRARLVVCLDLARDDAELAVLAREHGAVAIAGTPLGTQSVLDLMRHHPPVATEQEVISVGTIRLDRSRHEVRISGRLAHVPRKEFELLAYLLERAPRLATTGELLEWFEGGRIAQLGALRTLIRNLRRRLELAGAPPTTIVTVRGVGYRVEPEGEVMPSARSQGE